MYFLSLGVTKKHPKIQKVAFPIFPKHAASCIHSVQDNMPSPTLQKCAFWPCGHFDFKSTATAHCNDEFKSSFDSSYSHSLDVET